MTDPNKIPSLKKLSLGTMSSEAMCKYLDGVVANEGALAGANQHCIAAAHNGPIKAIYSVKLARLPPQVALIVQWIRKTDNEVIDMNISHWSDKKYSGDTDKEINQRMKAISKLQEHDPKFGKDMRVFEQMTSKERTAAIEKMESLTKSITPDSPGSMRSWHQNDPPYLPEQTITDPAALAGKSAIYHEYIVENKGLQNKQKKKGVEVVYTGYVEYTVGGWAQGIHDGRVCYDYVNKRFFFTATHYQIRPGRIDKNPWWQIMV
jgi:hypothetical protein